MNGRELLEAMSFLDEDLVASSNAPRRSSPWKRFAALAACFCVLILGTFSLFLLRSTMGAKSSQTEAISSDGILETWAAAEEFPAEAAGGTDNSASLKDSGASAAAVPESRKWIVTVSIDAETEDLDAMLENLEFQIQALGGYVQDQRLTNGSRYASTRYRDASLTVRIPAEMADDFTRMVSDDCNVVRSSKSMEDVTLTYVATESRMKALQTEEARLLELMEQAQTMADLLEIEQRLTDVRYELESVTSQLRSYDDLVNYATIYLHIYEVTEYTPVTEETLWQRISGGFLRSLKGLKEALLNTAVWLIVNLPYLVVILVIAWAAIAVIRRLRRKKPGNKAKKKDI